MCFGAYSPSNYFIIFQNMFFVRILVMLMGMITYMKCKKTRGAGAIRVYILLIKEMKLNLIRVAWIFFKNMMKKILQKFIFSLSFVYDVFYHFTGNYQSRNRRYK